MSHWCVGDGADEVVAERDYGSCQNREVDRDGEAHVRFEGVAGLRVADASVMPNVISGNTNAPAIMIGERAAEMLAQDHQVQLHDFVGG